METYLRANWGARLEHKKPSVINDVRTCTRGTNRLVPKPDASSAAYSQRDIKRNKNQAFRWSSAGLPWRSGCSVPENNRHGLPTSICTEGTRIRWYENMVVNLRFLMKRVTLSSATVHATLLASRCATPRFSLRHVWSFFSLLYHVRLSLGLARTLV